jgi:predicted DNA-binding transcriptional regulator AlpA
METQSGSDTRGEGGLLLRTREAAKLLGMSPRALDAWRSAGRGPRFVRVSARCVRYRRRDLEEWAEARLAPMPPVDFGRAVRRP